LKNSVTVEEIDCEIYLTAMPGMHVHQM